MEAKSNNNQCNSVILEVITSPKLCKYVFMMNLLTIIDSGRNNNPGNIFLWDSNDVEINALTLLNQRVYI